MVTRDREFIMDELFIFVNELKKVSRNIKITLECQSQELGNGDALIINCIYYQKNSLNDMRPVFGKKITITKDLLEEDIHNAQIKYFFTNVYNSFSIKILGKIG